MTMITYGIHQGKPFRESQEIAYEFITNSTKRFICLSSPTGCHAKGQGILMYNGSIVENGR